MVGHHKTVQRTAKALLKNQNRRDRKKNIDVYLHTSVKQINLQRALHANFSL